MLLAPFSSCCCYEFWLPFPPATAEAFAAAAADPPMEKHHGKNHLPAGKHHTSEGRRSPKIAPRKLPNVTSETHRK